MSKKKWIFILLLSYVLVMSACGAKGSVASDDSQTEIYIPQ